MKTDPLRPLLLFVPAVLLLGVAPLAGQDRPSIVPGDRVRVHQVGSPAVTGSLLWITHDSLTYAVGPEDPVELTVAFRDLKRLEVSRGSVPTGQRFLGGASIGLMAGGVLGGLLAYATYEPCRPPDVPFGALACLGHPSEELATLGGITIGVLLGGLVGGLIALENAGERWERVDYPTRVTLSPAGARGVTLSVAIPR